MTTRREFITLVGGAAAAWPLTAQAQRPAMPVIGFLSSRSPGESASVVASFRKGLSGTGFTDGQNLAIDFRWADGQYDRLPALARELVALQVDAIAATGDAVSALAAKSATTSIAIIFVIGGDPVRFGLVASINRPGGNISGVSLVSAGLGAKRLGLLHELIPNAAVILKRASVSRSSGQRCDDDYAVPENGVVVGRIFKVPIAPQDYIRMWASRHNGHIRRGGARV
jgi:putative tryptophan/tyrosine transport system substrate-binding protein